MSSKVTKHSIAVIGLACWYPGASTPLQLWENILARRRQFRRIPNCRFPLSDYYHPDPLTPDKTYGRKAAVIDGFEFDWAAMRIPLATFKSTDISHWLALETALAAIMDAGYTRKTIPGQHTGVIVGNTLTGEQTRANTLRLRWPYVEKAFKRSAQDGRLPEDRVESLSRTLEQQFKSVFPPVTEDTLAGGLSNTIAGRICNYLNLSGGGYTIDGACSSSLLAVANAAARLVDGDLSLAIAGGVDVSLDPFELIGFAKTGALTQGDMTVYDRRGSGFIPGEGCGFLVLKRYKDAVKDRNEIYAVLHGWGISSDGGGAGIAAPSAKGQAQAIRKAYDKSPYKIGQLDFIEGHGTGTAVGDRTELEGISLAMRNSHKMPPRSCGVTSFKSLVGHTKAASGVGGLIKAIMAVNRRVIPPTAACRLPHPAFDHQAKALYPVCQGSRIAKTRTMRAGVSAMGFGGINCHVTLSSADPPNAKFMPDLPEEKLMASSQDTELFVLSANTAAGLETKIQEAIAFTQEISLAEMSDLAAMTAHQIDRSHPIRAAVIADSPDALQKRWERLLKLIRDTPPISEKKGCRNDVNQMVWYSHNISRSKIGFLFPGQGSQQLNMGTVLVKRYDWAREIIQMADKSLKEISDINLSQLIYRPLEKAGDRKEIDQWTQALSQPETAQPAVCTGSLLWLTLLRKLGVTPLAVGGHSLGEVTAFSAAGAFDPKSLLRFAALRGRAMTQNGNEGAMVSLKCPREKAESLIQDISDYLILANINSPTQMVLSGETAAVDMVIQMASAEGILSHRLNVSSAFHSLLAEPAAEIISRQTVLPPRLEALNCRLFSSTHGKEVKPGIELAPHFAKQLKSQVNFIDMVQSMSIICDLMIEVGPGQVLTGLVRDIQSPGSASCLPIASAAEGDLDLNRSLAALYVHGADIHWPLLYEKRLIRPFIPPVERRFIQNPCEKILDRPAPPPLPSPPKNIEQLLTDLTRIPPEEFKTYLAARGPFIAQIIQTDINFNWPAEPNGPSPAPPARPSMPDVILKPAIKWEKPADGIRQATDVIYELINESTGFPKESIPASARLLDDLNLDSIKAEDLLVKFSRKLGFSWPEAPNILANASIEEIVSAAKRICGHLLPVAPPPAHVGNDAAEVTLDEAETIRLFLSIVTEITGFSEESLSLDARLTDDLNLDSIKIHDLIARFAHTMNINPQIDTQETSQATLKDLLAIFLRHRRPSTSIILPPMRPPSADSLDVVIDQAAKITGFRRSSIDPDALVERDLHMNPEMLKALLQRSAVVLGTEAQVDIQPLRTRSLRQISQIYSRILKREPIGRLSPAKEAPLEVLMRRSDAWVRNFEMHPVEAPLPPLPAHWGKRREDDWQTANVLVLHRQDNIEVAEALADHLLEQGAQVKSASFYRAHQERMGRNPAFSHLIAVLPRTEIPAQTTAEYLQKSIEQLASLTRAAPASKAPRPRTTLTYVTFGGGYFGMDGRFAELSQCGAVAIGATLHLERNDLRVRVIDFSTAVEPERIAATVLKEIHTLPAFAAAGYDYKLKRRIIQPTLSHPVDYTSRGISWSHQDVLLVTGGAKGITAACALAAAKAAGVRAALLGRSPHPDDLPEHPASKEILRTLKQYADQGLTAEYFCCDVADAGAVETTIAAIESQMGAVSGVIHGAGVNAPRPARQVSPEKAFEEVGPKVLGVLNIHRSLSPKPPKLIVGLSSVISVTGMPGNAWYGFSNEALEVLLQRFAHDHPETQTLAVAYSIWDEEGMGTRLGSVAHLTKMGIQSISPPKGLKRFVQLFLNRPPSSRVVVTSRIGGLDTWFPPPPSKTVRGRFTSDRLSGVPGIESIFKVQLSLASDPYLKDHHFQGTYLFPTVFGLEAMAQAAVHAAQLHHRHDIVIEDIRLERPITVAPDIGADILIHAVVHEKGSDSSRLAVSAGILKLNTGIHSDYFSARFIFTAKPRPMETDPLNPEARTALIPQADLYRDTLLFQGERFQRIKAIYHLTRENSYRGEAVFSTRMAPENENLALAFGTKDQGDLVLGDPFFRDTLLQSATLLAPQDTSLPIFIERLSIHPLHIDTSLSIMARTQLSKRSGKDLVYQVKAIDNRGNIIESLSGYRLRILTHHDDYPTVDDLIDPTKRDRLIINECLAHWSEQFKGQLPLLEVTYHPGIHKLSPNKRHPVEFPLIHKTSVRLAELGVRLPDPLEISWSPDEKPRVEGMDQDQADLSISHDDRLCICVAGKGPTACEVIPITYRDRMTWRNILGIQRDHMIDAMLKISDSLNQVGTRLLALNEVLQKIAVGSDAPVEVLKYKDGAVLFKAATPSGDYTVLTLLLRLTWGPEKILAVTFHPRHATTMETKSSSNYRRIYGDLGEKRSYDMLADGPQGQMVFVQRRPLTFKPNAQLSRTIYFSNYVNWMGEVREASIWPIMPSIKEQLATGRWGNASNFSHIQILGEASVDDMIETRMWISDNGGPENSTMTLSYDFRRIGMNGKDQRLAFCRHQTTWVEMVGQGIVKARPYPPYLRDFLETMLPRYDAPDAPSPLAEPLKNLLLDRADDLIYQAPEAPIIQPMLSEHKFETSLSHSNMMGNVYFAVYYEWKAQTRDRYFFKLIPEYFQGTGKKGEMICLESRLDHLREAMPFDTILVRMALKSLRKYSMVLQFDFHRLNPDNTRTKMAFGHHRVAWVIRDSSTQPAVAPWPEALMRVFKHKITQTHSGELNLTP